jgi:hypothetical protein
MVNTDWVIFYNISNMILHDRHANLLHHNNMCIWININHIIQVIEMWYRTSYKLVFQATNNA